MTYFDISGRLELPTKETVDFLSSRIITELHSLEVDADVIEGDKIRLHVPLIKAGTRGFRLQGVHFAEIELTHRDGQSVVLYKIAMLPIRYLSILFALTGVLWPPLEYIATRKGDFCSFGIMAVTAIAFGAFTYSIGKSIASTKIAAFVRSVIT